MSDRIGQQLGNYRLLRLLGHGGFADVYLGEHLYLRTPAAIKVLRTQLASNDLEHFLNEARTIANLVHPSIVRVLDFGVENNIPFLVMEYAPHGTLRQRYPRGTLLPLGEIMPYVVQVATALEYAHSKKLIHRDVKPENMLLGRQQEVLLSDFGLAALAHSSGSLSTKEAAGTLPYMAPEQIEGHPRAASDQYALGVVVYEWLCGARPFEGSMTEVMVQQLTMPAPPLHEKVATIPLEIEQVVLAPLVVDGEPRARQGRKEHLHIIADQREAFRAARQIIARGARHTAERHADGLANQKFRAGRLAVGFAGIARVELPAAVRTEAVDTVEIQRRRAEILDGGRICLLVAEGSQIQRDVVVDELSEIGEPCGNRGVVAGRIVRTGVLHRVGKFLQRTVVDGERFEVRKHSSEHSGIVVPGKRIEKLSGRLAATFAMARLDIHLCCHHFLQSDVGRRGVPVSRDVRSIKAQENPIDTPQKGSVSKTHP